MTECNTSERPGKIRITTPGNEIWVDEVLHLPVGMMFCVEDYDTGEPVICTMTYGGVLIEEWDGEMTPETLHEMIIQQEENATRVMEMMISNKAACEAAELLKQTVDERNMDVI